MHAMLVINKYAERGPHVEYQLYDYEPQVLDSHIGGFTLHLRAVTSPETDFFPYTGELHVYLTAEEVRRLVTSAIKDEVKAKAS